uniref:Uncharacterized protein n=1 Tax=Setaria digitata TaxID=48799 RepID=A0A915PLG7_9BILA
MRYRIEAMKDTMMSAASKRYRRITSVAQNSALRMVTSTICPSGAINLYSKHKNGCCKSADDGYDRGSNDDDNSDSGECGKFGDWKIPVELKCTQRQLANEALVSRSKSETDVGETVSSSDTATVDLYDPVDFIQFHFRDLNLCAE